MSDAQTLKKISKLVTMDPYFKNKLALKIGIVSTTTIDKWIQSKKISKLKRAVVVSALKEMESK